MEPKDLVKVWDAPDHSRLMPKQVSIRLPILAAARIAALCEMYPSKSKSQIIADLIATSLDQVQEGLPSKKGKALGPDIDYLAPDPEIDQYADPQFRNEEPVPLIFEDIGPRGQFLRLTKKHLREFEKEAGINEPIPVPDPITVE